MRIRPIEELNVKTAEACGDDVALDERDYQGHDRAASNRPNLTPCWRAADQDRGDRWSEIAVAGGWQGAKRYGCRVYLGLPSL
jgi:hypothetical protein